MPVFGIASSKVSAAEQSATCRRSVGRRWGGRTHRSGRGFSWCDRHASDQSPAPVPPFSTSRATVRLYRRRIDQHLRRRSARRSQSLKDVLPDALVRPANEAVVERLARPVDQGRIHPAAACFQDMYDAADDPPVVHPRLAPCIHRKMRLKPRKLVVRQPEKVIVHPKAPFGNLESQDACQGKRFYRS